MRAFFSAFTRLLRGGMRWVKTRALKSEEAVVSFSRGLLIGRFDFLCCLLWGACVLRRLRREKNETCFLGEKKGFCKGGFFLLTMMLIRIRAWPDFFRSFPLVP